LGRKSAGSSSNLPIDFRRSKDKVSKKYIIDSLLKAGPKLNTRKYAVQV